MADDAHEQSPDRASHGLLSAALAGLLCLAAPGCSSGDSHPGAVIDASSLFDTTSPIDATTTADSTAPGDTATASDTTATGDDASDAATSDGEPASDGETASDAPEETASETADATPTDAAKDCALEAGTITSSSVDPTMTLEVFTKLCEERGGTLELHSHCGGLNSCKGMSYDTGTQVFTEHTCRALNTCAGYSCLDPC